MTDASKNSVPTWFWIVGGLGLAWNVFGVVQFLTTAGASVDALVKGGMTLAQAEFYAKLPIWLHAAFAIGVFGGMLGCILLMLRRANAVIVLPVSLVAYVVLFALDALLGVFAMFGAPQVAILSSVVLIAAALLWFARSQQSKGVLR